MTDPINQTVGYIDLLGFSELTLRSTIVAREVLSDFYNIANSLSSQYQIRGVVLFSDSLIVQGDTVDSVINYMSACYRNCFLMNRQYIDEQDGKHLLCRGGITNGEYFTETRNASQNVGKHFFISPAIVHDAQIEKKIKGSRLIIGCNDGEIQDFLWNRNLESIVYRNVDFKLFRGYTYHDVLWPIDRTKNHEDQETEVRETIDVARIHLENASKNEKSHYISTFRIALLSYAKFVEIATVPRSFIHSLLDYFSDKPEYWEIWLALIEIICSSSENFAYLTQNEFIEFYKYISLTPEWGLALKKLSLPSNAWLREHINNEVFTNIFKTGLNE